MSAASVLARGRAAAEALMVDACTITRTTVTGTDPDTGQQTTSTATIYDDGKCRIQQIGQGGGTARPTDVGEATVYQQKLTLQLPMAVVGVDNADIVTITESEFDPDLVGRRFWVKELAHKTHATARRIGLEEVTS